MRLAHPAMGRTARDVDLLCALPFDEASVRDVLAAVLQRDVGDGVRFAERFRTDAIWTETAHPGIRVMAPALAEGRWGEVHVDLTFQLPPWPRPHRLQTEGMSLAACRPETLVARKLTVSEGLGPQAWRAKDLADVWWLLHHGGAELSAVGQAVEQVSSLQRLAEGPGRAAFWRQPRALCGWARLGQHQRGLAVPRDPEVVVGDVLSRLAPLIPEEACR